jgi:hypothetical protein
MEGGAPWRSMTFWRRQPVGWSAMVPATFLRTRGDEEGAVTPKMEQELIGVIAH